MTRRFVSWIVDYLVILAWLAALAVVIGIPSLAGWFALDDVWSDPVATDIAITLLTVVPLFAYLTVTESRPAHATVGKRRTGLEVTNADGSPPSGARIAIRNLVKVLPWQLGHMGSARLAAGDAEALGLTFNTAAMLILVLVAVPPLLGRRGLHEVTSGTDVVASA